MTGSAARFSLVLARRLSAHEEVEAKHVEELAARIRAEGALYQPIVADAGSLVVLDGHHRFAALQRLGCQLIPCHLVDYGDPAITVEDWEDGTPMDKQELISRGLSGDLMPIKTSRHRTLRALPPRPTGISRLRPTEGEA